MSRILFSPPVVFCAFLLLFAVLLKRAGRFAARADSSERALDPYACGQRDFENYVNPDYTQFFRYAFVFTVMHVVALVIATAPPDAAALPYVYVAAGIMALFIIFRK